MSASIIIPALLLAVYVIAECVNFVITGSSLISGLIRVVRQLINGSKEINLPEDLKMAAANGLFTVGSEIIVGSQGEWDGASVGRYALEVDLIQEEVGTVMKVIRLTDRRVELVRMPPSPSGGVDQITW